MMVLRVLRTIPFAVLCCLALAALPAPPERGRTEQKEAARRGPRPGDPLYALFLRNGYAAGIEGLWVIGRIDTDQLVAELEGLLAEGPCPKAQQVLHRLAQNGWQA